ncbi:MAG TPA: lysozyme inhibitor LprI family protein [Candidatus Angelobacter sp.]|nr:lysozyme inhibitor LprI family protein [Candidatus Angelobacter sp.]
MNLRKIAPAMLAAVLSILAVATTARADDASDPLAQSQKILEAQLKALGEVLSPELQQSLSASQQSWTAYRDQQCAFELKFAQEQGRTRFKESEGREAGCVARFNQQRLQQLQQNLNTLMQMLGRPPSFTDGMNEGDYLPKNCRLTGLPDKFEVHAVGIYAGTEPADVRLGTGNHEAKGATVVVNKPGVPVVLVLMGYDPVVWHVSWTKDTKIAAVIVGSTYKQAVLGIDKATPLQVYSNEDHTACGSFYAYTANQGLTRANDRIKAITGQEMMDLINKPTNGRFIVGPETGIDFDRLIDSPERKLEDYGAIEAPSGVRGLDALIGQGKLRHATKADFDAFIDKASAPYRKLNPTLTVKLPFMPIERSYVVLAPVDLPPGLSGSTSMFFFVPDGVTAPTGANGSFLLMMSTGACLMGGTMPCPG